jgi:hypothetical protein
MIYTGPIPRSHRLLDACAPFDRTQSVLWMPVHVGLSTSEVAEDGNYAKSRPKSKAGAEWVSAPTAR